MNLTDDQYVAGLERLYTFRKADDPSPFDGTFQAPLDNTGFDYADDAWFDVVKALNEVRKKPALLDTKPRLARALLGKGLLDYPYLGIPSVRTAPWLKQLPAGSQGNPPDSERPLMHHYQEAAKPDAQRSGESVNPTATAPTTSVPHHLRSDLTRNEARTLDPDQKKQRRKQNSQGWHSRYMNKLAQDMGDAATAKMVVDHFRLSVEHVQAFSQTQTFKDVVVPQFKTETGTAYVTKKALTKRRREQRTGVVKAPLSRRRRPAGCASAAPTGQQPGYGGQPVVDNFSYTAPEQPAHTGIAGQGYPGQGYQRYTQVGGQLLYSETSAAPQQHTNAAAHIAWLYPNAAPAEVATHLGESFPEVNGYTGPADPFAEARHHVPAGVRGSDLQFPPLPDTPLPYTPYYDQAGPAVGYHPPGYPQVSQPSYFETSAAPQQHTNAAAHMARTYPNPAAPSTQVAPHMWRTSPTVNDRPPPAGAPTTTGTSPTRRQ
jgi:hypothetical protein